MTRLVHKATDALGPEAQRAMIAGFREKATYRAIAGRLAAMGEKVSERVIARRAVEWRGEQTRRQAAKEQMGALIAAAQENDYNAAEMIRALGCDALVMNPNGFAGADPLKVQSQNLWAEELRIKREALDVRQRAVAVEETRLRLLEARERRALETLEKPDAAMTPQERIREIQAIYGIKQEASGQ